MKEVLPEFLAPMTRTLHVVRFTIQRDIRNGMRHDPNGRMHVDQVLATQPQAPNSRCIGKPQQECDRNRGTYLNGVGSFLRLTRRGKLTVLAALVLAKLYLPRFVMLPTLEYGSSVIGRELLLTYPPSEPMTESVLFLPATNPPKAGWFCFRGSPLLAASSPNFPERISTESRISFPKRFLGKPVAPTEPLT
jgi:hypothetical protein